jgi:hypothetical protein
MKTIFTLLLLFSYPAEASIFGEENIALMKLVIGQITELEKLSEAIGVAKENRDLLVEINEGINKVTDQLDAIDEIVKRAERLNPTSIRKISDITSLINDAKAVSRDLDSLLSAKLLLADEAILSSGLQSETAYAVGQEMIKSGSRFSGEARIASPGRAAQISAAASSAQMMATGTLLQTMSQLTQLQAIDLEFKKSEMQRINQNERQRRKAASEFLRRKP